MILIFAGISGVYLSRVNREYYESQVENKEMQMMDAITDSVKIEVETQAYYHGSSTVYTCTQILKDELLINKSFAQSFGQYMENNWGNSRTIANFKMEIDDYDVNIYLDERNTHDIVQSNKTKTQSLGSDITAQTSDIDTAGECRETSKLAYYYVAGVINCTVTDLNSGMRLQKPLLIERSLKSAYPFLKNKMESFKANAQGSSTEIGRMIKYILTTVAQYRVLQGYGNIESMGNINEIITKKDVEMAVNLALILETAKLYRSIDPQTVTEFDTRNFEGYDTGDHNVSRRLENMVTAYITNGTIDPADLFSLYIRLDCNRINLRSIIAQTVNALIDQFFLKYLDYLGLTGFADAFVDMAGEVTDAIDDLINWLSGNSDKLAKMVRDWIVNPKGGGLSDPNDRMMMNSVNTEVKLNCRDYEVVWWEREEVSYDPETNPTYDWVRYSRNVSFGGGSDTALFPMVHDIASDAFDNVWRVFFEENIGNENSAKKHYTSFRGIIEDYAKKIANDMSAYIDNPMLKINPRDNRSILEEAKTALLERIDEAITNIGDPAYIDAVADRLAGNEIELIEDLKTFISDHFDEMDNSSTHFYDSSYAMLTTSITIANKDRHYDWNGTPHYDPRYGTDLHHYVRTQVIYDIRGHEIAAKYDEQKWDTIDHINSVLDIQKKNFKDEAVRIINSDIDTGSLLYIVKRFVKRTLNSLIEAQEFGNLKFLQVVNRSVPFEFWNGHYEDALRARTISYEDVIVTQSSKYLCAVESYIGLENLSADSVNVNTLITQIVRPDEFYREGSSEKRNLDENPNIHYTDISNISSRPFETAWLIKIAGKVKISAETKNKVFLVNGTHHSTKHDDVIFLNISFPISIHSGWALKEVDGTADIHYNPSSTLLSDIIDFIEQIWKYIVSVIGSILDGLMKIVSFFTDIIGTLLSYATEIIKFISDAIQSLVDLIQKFIQSILDTSIGALIETIIDVIKSFTNPTFTFSAYGFTFIVSANMKRVKGNACGDILKVSTKGNLSGSNLDFNTRFVRYSKAADGRKHYDIIVDGTIDISGFILNLVIDPIMGVRNHIVEAHGKSVNATTGKGWGIDFYVPDADEYKEMGIALSDILHTPIIIPIPPLGVEASIDLGVKVKYGAPESTDIVLINEFESNPAGADAGNEWFELFYNPYAIDITDWTISTLHGRIVNKKLSELKIVKKSGWHIVYSFSAKTMDNGVKYNPHNPGDGLVLKDSSGKVIDRTPILIDSKNDGRTWQRSYDGSPKWEFKQKSQGASNGQFAFAFTYKNIRSIVGQMLKDSFKEVWYELLSEQPYDLDFIVKFVQRVIQRFIDKILSLIIQIVKEVVFYIDLAFQAIGGGVVGVGVKLAFVIDGTCLAELLRWLINNIAVYVYNIGNPNQPSSYFSLPRAVPEHMYVRFEVYTFGGVPSVIKENLPAEITCPLSIKIVASISLNVPAIVMLVGLDWGDWAIVFGVYLEDVPKDIASYLFGTSKDGDSLVDVWFIKARVYGIRGFDD